MTNYISSFNDSDIFDTTNEVMHIFEINAFFDMSYEVIDIHRFIVIHWIKEVNVYSVSSWNIVVKIFDALTLVFLKTERIKRIKKVWKTRDRFRLNIQYLFDNCDNDTLLIKSEVSYIDKIKSVFERFERLEKFDFKD